MGTLRDEICGFRSMFTGPIVYYVPGEGYNCFENVQGEMGVEILRHRIDIIRCSC